MERFEQPTNLNCYITFMIVSRGTPGMLRPVEYLWSNYGAAGHVSWSPEGHSNPSVMHYLDRNMMIDWSTGRILEGGPFRNLSFAQTLHPLRRFTGPSWVLISGLGGVEGHFVIVRRLGRACYSRSFSYKTAVLFTTIFT
jgi:hypothetical protein